MKPIRTLASFAVAAALMLPAAAAQAVTFDVATEPYEGSSNGVFELSEEALSRAVFTNENGNSIEIVTFSPGGSSAGQVRDTFGSGPPALIDTQLFGQRAVFWFGNTAGPEVRYCFESTVKLVSATFMLCNPSQNLEIAANPVG